MTLSTQRGEVLQKLTLHNYGEVAIYQGLLIGGQHACEIALSCDNNY